MLINFLNFFIGSCLASHAMVIFERYERGKSFIFCRSKCIKCQRTLKFYDLVPILSFLLLKGRCRYCQVKIPRNLFLAEVFGGLIFLNENWLTGAFKLTIIFFLFLMAIFDYYTQTFPTIFWIIPFTLSLYHLLTHPHQFDLINLLPISILLLLFVFQNKMGSGDLLIYLLVATSFGSRIANYTLLFGAILLLIDKVFQRNFSSSEPIAFVPYIFLGLILILKFGIINLL